MKFRLKFILNVSFILTLLLIFNPNNVMLVPKEREVLPIFAVVIYTLYYLSLDVKIKKLISLLVFVRPRVQCRMERYGFEPRSARQSMKAGRIKTG